MYRRNVLAATRSLKRFTVGFVSPTALFGDHALPRGGVFGNSCEAGLQRIFTRSRCQTRPGVGCSGFNRGIRSFLRRLCRPRKQDEEEERASGEKHT